MIPAAAAAGNVAIRPEFQVSQYGTYSYYGYVYPNAHNEGTGSVDIHASAAGTFVVVWEDLYSEAPGYYGGDLRGVFVRRLDELGRPLGNERRVSGLSSYAQGSVAVGSDPTGRFVVVWDDHNAYAQGDADVGILARRFNASGGALGGSFLVNTYTTGYQFTPKVAMDGAGNFVVVWADPYYGPSYPGGRIAGRRFDSTGTPLGSQFQVNSGTSCQFCAYSGFEGFALFDDMDVAADGSGNFMVVWTGPDAAEESFDVKARLYDSTGAPVASEFTVNSSTTSGESAPTVAADGSGHFIVAWGEFFGYDVHTRRFDSAGGPIGSEFQVNTVPIYHFAYGPSVAADSAGSFVVTWDDQDDLTYGIFARAFDSTGTPVADQFRVDESPDYDGDESSLRCCQNVGASAAGDFIVAWSQYNLGVSAAGVVGRLLGEAPVECAPVPMTDCREPTIPGRGVFRFKHGTSPSRRSLIWRWVRGQAADPEDFGDPFTTDSYAFCVYDASASPQPLVDMAVPGGGACGAVPCWLTLSGGRIHYFDPKLGFVEGLRLIRMTPGIEGRTRVAVRAKGEALDLPPVPLTLPVTVQVQVSNGECWSAAYSTFIRRNDAGVFKASPGSPSGAFLDIAPSVVD